MKQPLKNKELSKETIALMEKLGVNLKDNDLQTKELSQETISLMKTLGVNLQKDRDIKNNKSQKKH